MQKKDLILFLSRLDHPANALIAPTLAWMARSKDILFDSYYDSYHKGIHFPGGDCRDLETGDLTGGTVSGERHFEEFYFLLHNFNVSIISTGESIFSRTIKNLNIPVAVQSNNTHELYKLAFKVLDVPLPFSIVMVGSHVEKKLPGAQAYLYQDIYYRKAIGVYDSIEDDDLSQLCREGARIFSVYMNEETVSDLQKKGYDVEVVDRIRPDDDYLTLTERITHRWESRIKGWILGDPTLVIHWIPKACEEGLAAIYSVPQVKIVSQLGGLISSKGKVIYGRQYSDRDFFELSKLNQCLQVIDPCRPPFQSIKHAEYKWHVDGSREGFYEHEYSDDELRRFAREGRTLISLLFWSGMVREVENFHNLIDLLAMTRLRCGVVITAQSYEYMMHSPFELLTVPLEQGGVFPLVEPVLGSCGIGVGIESLMTKERLLEDVREGLSGILSRVQNETYMPKGWWATMDTDMEQVNRREGPWPFRFLGYPPYMQFRFELKDKQYSRDSSSDKDENSQCRESVLIERSKRFIKDKGLMKYFEPYRPYEFYRAGEIKLEIIEAIKSAGLKYMFTKSGFNSFPKVHYLDEDFIALNYTAGQWDGWTPFETVNDVSDLRKAEKKIMRGHNPGWIVSTIDSCLWTFSGEFWKRGSRLLEIAKYCAEGGDSKKLINAKPYTVARYARIIEGNS